MTGAELHKALMPAFGPVPSLPVREATVALLKGSSTVALRYEWVKNWAPVHVLVDSDRIDLADGEEWFALTLRTD